MTYDTIAAVETAIENFVVENKIETIGKIELGPINYGEQLRKTGLHSVEISKIKGKNTRKALQIIVERFGLNDGSRMGKYELVIYAN